MPYTGPRTSVMAPQERYPSESASPYADYWQKNSPPITAPGSSFAQIGTQQQPALAAPPVSRTPGLSPMRIVNAPTVNVPTASAPVGPTRPTTTGVGPWLPMVTRSLTPTSGTQAPTFPLGASGIVDPVLEYTMNSPLIMRQRLAQMAGQTAPTAGQPTGGGGTYRAWGAPPQNIIDAGLTGWWDQFAQEHPYRTKDGRTVYLTPDQVYDRDGEYAVAHALHDKAWGDQFYRTYGRPPTEDDWKTSYYDRQRSFYGG